MKLSLHLLVAVLILGIAFLTIFAPLIAAMFGLLSLAFVTIHVAHKQGSYSALKFFLREVFFGW